MLQIVLIALALSMDAFAVSIGSGICVPSIKPFHALRASVAFGFFQFAMPVAGWLIGVEFGKRIGARFERWAELTGGLVLIFIGTRILIEHLVGVS